MALSNPNLLRRTVLAVAAAVGFFASLAPQAAVVTLANTTGASCSYSSLSITPDGNVSVQCTATGPVTTGDAGSFALATGAATANVGDTVPVTIVRSSGTTGAVTVPYSITGSGCTNTSGSASFADGLTSVAVNVGAIAAGTCNVSISTPSTAATVSTAPRVGTPGTEVITVNAVQPPATSGCAAPPADMVQASFRPIGNVLLQMQHSGQVVSMPLPEVVSGYHSGQVVFSESAGGAYTPQPVTLNISISKCPGIVDTDTSNSCNLVNTNGNYNAMVWFASSYSVIQDAASAARYSFCWAPRSEGQWYVNARWTYSSCAFGAQVCGFAVQQNYGSW